MLGQNKVHKMVHNLPTTIAEVANLTLGRLSQFHTEIVIQKKFVGSEFFSSLATLDTSMYDSQSLSSGRFLTTFDCGWENNTQSDKLHSTRENRNHSVLSSFSWTYNCLNKQLDNKAKYRRKTQDEIYPK